MSLHPPVHPSGVHGEPAGGPGTGPVRQRLPALSRTAGCSDRLGGGSGGYYSVSAGGHPDVQVPPAFLSDHRETVPTATIQTDGLVIFLCVLLGGRVNKL